MPQGGFSPLRLEGWRIRRDLPGTSVSLSLLPAYTARHPVCLRPSCFSVDPPKVGSVDAMYCTTMQWNAPPTPGALAPVRVMLSRPSSLTRPHPPRPRAVPVFRCTFRPDMPSPKTPGSSTSVSSRAVLHRPYRPATDETLRYTVRAPSAPRS